MEPLTFVVVLAGSVLQRGDAAGIYVQPFIARALHAVAPNARLRALRAEPVLGSLLLAMELDHAEISDETYGALTQTLAV
jgi:hypothetical protein